MSFEAGQPAPTQAPQEGGEGFYGQYQDFNNPTPSPIDEPPQEDPAPQPPQNEELYTSQFAKLAERERAFLERERKFKEEMDAFNRKREEPREDEELYNKFKEAMKYKEHDPLGAIEAIDMKFDDIASHYQDDNKPQTRREAMQQQQISQIMEEVKALREEREKEAERKKKEEEERIYNERYEGFMGKMREIAEKEMMEDGVEKYELLKGQGKRGEEKVIDIVNNHYQKTGKLMDIKEAMDILENSLEQELQGVLKYKKFRKYGNPIEQKPDSPMMESETFFDRKQQTSEPHQAGTPTTLSNTMTPSDVPNSTRPKSREESIRRASSLLRWND